MKQHRFPEDVLDLPRRLVGRLAALHVQVPPKPQGPPSPRSAVALAWSLFSAALLGCGVGCERGSEVAERTLVEPHTGRPYRIFERSTHRGAPGDRPVLVVLHPFMVPPDTLLEAYRLRERAAADRDWVVVVPEGTRDAENNPRWNATKACCASEPNGPDDVGYLRSVLADLPRHTAFDETRIFLLGTSNGGFMAHRFACEASDQVRAIVSVSGAGPGPADPPCRPTHPVSVLQVHGVQDETILYQGGVRRGAPYPSARDSLGPWKKDSEDCQTSRTTRAVHLFGPRVEVETHVCPGRRVELWSIPRGDHNLSPIRHAVPDLLDFLESS